jgi:hypothetical protein
MNTIITLWKNYHTYVGLICMFVLGGLVGVHAVNQATFDMFAPMIAAWTGYGVLRAVKTQPTQRVTKPTKTK